MFKDDETIMDNPTAVYSRLEEIGEIMNALSEEKINLMTRFFNDYQDYEFPVTDKDGKEKYFRVYEVEGRFVYNTKFELGLRVKPVKIYEGEVK